MATKKAARQILAALDAYQASEDAIGQLDAARRAREAAQELESVALKAARQAGATWKDIGECYGLTKQGAQQRFHRAAPPEATKGTPARRRDRPGRR